MIMINPSVWLLYMSILRFSALRCARCGCALVAAVRPGGVFGLLVRFPGSVLASGDPRAVNARAVKMPNSPNSRFRNFRTSCVARHVIGVSRGIKRRICEKAALFFSTTRPRKTIFDRCQIDLARSRHERRWPFVARYVFYPVHRSLR